MKYYVFFNSLTIEERIFNNFFLKYVKEHLLFLIKLSIIPHKIGTMPPSSPYWYFSQCKYTTYFLNKQIIFTLFLFFVDLEGHDPPTFGLWVRCSNQLSYRSYYILIKLLNGLNVVYHFIRLHRLITSHIVSVRVELTSTTPLYLSL